MSKKKKQNKKIRDKFGTVTLKELIESGKVYKFFHLQDHNIKGGIINSSKK